MYVMYGRYIYVSNKSIHECHGDDWSISRESELSMIFHTKLLEVNVNAGKLGLGLGQLSMKKPYSISIIPPYYTQLVRQKSLARLKSVPGLVAQ